MNALTPSATADIFGIAAGFGRLFRSFSQTSVNVDAVPRDVGRIITQWDNALADMPGATTTQDVPFPTDPVNAVEHIARLLALPHERVIAAMRVAPRTYYGWKTEGRHARPQSLGQLWPMTQAIHYMARAHPNLAAWFNTSREAQALFDAGDVDRLVQLELDWAIRTYPRRKAISAEFEDAGVAVGSLHDGVERPTHASPTESHPRARKALHTDDVAEVKLTPGTGLS